MQSVLCAHAELCMLFGWWMVQKCLCWAGKAGRCPRTCIGQPKAAVERNGGADDGTQSYHCHNSFLHFLHFSQQEIRTRESLSAGHTRSLKLLPCKHLYSRQWVLCIRVNRNSALFSNTRVFYSNSNLCSCYHKTAYLQPISTKRLFPTCPDMSLQAPCSLLCWFIFSFFGHGKNR